MTDITCPACGAEFDLTVAFACEEERRAFARLASVSIPLGTRVLKYIALFTPPKQRLTSAKKLKLLMQLLPDLERKAITHKGRDWTAPLDAWAQAFDQMQHAVSAIGEGFDQLFWVDASGCFAFVQPAFGTRCILGWRHPEQGEIIAAFEVRAFLAAKRERAWRT